MNIDIIYEYVRRLTKKDIAMFALRQGIILDNNELDILYSYIKKNYQKIIEEDEKDILKEVEGMVKSKTYDKILALYDKFKEKISNFKKNIRGA